MPIRLNYTFYARDESEAESFSRMMMDDLRSLLSAGVEMDILPPTPSSRREACWDAGAKIYFADGNSNPARESAEAENIADGMGAPWEKYDDGEVRVLEPGTGGFSGSFGLMKRAELRLEAAERAAIGLTGMGYGLYRFVAGTIRMLLRSAAMISIAVGILAVVGQALCWAMGLGWPELPLFTLFAFLISPDGSIYNWLAAAQGWYGLNELAIRMLHFVPASLFLIVFGVLLLAVQRPRLKSGPAGN